MPSVDWNRVLHRVGAELERQYDATKREIAFLTRTRRRPAVLIAYRGFATDGAASLRGRVLRDSGFAGGSPEDRWWTNLRNTLRLIRSHEVPGARVRMCFRGGTAEVVADDDGYFEGRVAFEGGAGGGANGAPWDEATLELLAPVSSEDSPVTVAAPVLAPPRGTPFGVISDMDDTVLHTDTGRVIRMTLRVLLGNAHTRLPFPGVAAFYRALQAGGGGATPFFYVSSSPWNLYEVLVQFLEVNGIPAGPMFLRDWGFSGQPGSRGHRGHKQAAIRRIMEAYPELPFILIGDTAQRDPEIYAGVVHDWPDRVLAVYIHDVSRRPDRAEAVHALAAEVEAAGSTLILAPDTLEAARHAAGQGWIDPGSLPDIEADRRQDGAEPDDDDDDDEP